MADDIVTRLRRNICWCADSYFLFDCEACQAATEIERLRDEVKDMDQRIVTLIGEHQALAIAYASAVTRG